LSKKFLAGELPAERLYVKPPAFYEDPPTTVMLGTRVESIDRSARALALSDGTTVPYDTLILAVGARVRPLPPMPGSDLEGIHYLRNVHDVQAIQKDFAAGRNLVIVGAGYIGLEVAAVAASLGLDVTVIEMQDRVMKRVVAPPVSEFYEREHRSRGVNLMLETGIEGFNGRGRVDGVMLTNGKGVVPADLVVTGIGIVPNTELAAAAGLEVADGIVVDDRCRTADCNIYAVGDCTLHPNRLIGRRVRLESVQNALEQARTAAANICGEDVQYAEVPWFWSDQYDLKLQIAGLSQGYDRAVLRGNPDSRSFSCVYLADERMIALDAVNNPKDFLQAKGLIADGKTLKLDRLADARTELKDLVA
jgi:3-phenylpropionate/trans-cinnamate dioxygenase ferredoxin reductase subunit